MQPDMAASATPATMSARPFFMMLPSRVVMRHLVSVNLRGVSGKARTLCLDNGRVDTIVDPERGLRSSGARIFTCFVYERLIPGLRGFAFRKPEGCHRSMTSGVE
jgi:hypothetical protein